MSLGAATTWTVGSGSSATASRFDVLGVGVSSVEMNSALSTSTELIDQNRKGYICVTGVHGVMEARRDGLFRGIQNKSLLTVPDGTPLVWIAWAKGLFAVRRVYGPDFMLALCQKSVERGDRHFFYGGRTGVASRLAEEMAARFPGISIVGTYTPPFRELNSNEELELIDQIAKAKPDIFWVGLSTPKQERFMNGYIDKLNVKLMVGVGAAFDIHTGSIKDAPYWCKVAGMQWAHRLVQEPRRLWKRYLINNPLFVSYVILQFLGKRWS
jgi:N-acetylglucosaminyldiphosphoundecaprenol N-acetyl-beta-D-mannosaminyltransferase